MGLRGWTVAVPAIGALFNLGAGCQKGKHLDIPVIYPPPSDAVVNFVVRGGWFPEMVTNQLSFTMFLILTNMLIVM